MGQCVSDIPQVIWLVVTQYTECVEFTGCFIVKDDQIFKPKTYCISLKITDSYGGKSGSFLGFFWKWRLQTKIQISI